MPPLTPSAPDSRDAADVRLLLSYLEGQNLGCASCGGYRYTTLPVITWYPVPRPATADYPQQADGTIGPSGSTGPEFSADLVAERRVAGDDLRLLSGSRPAA